MLLLVVEPLLAATIITYFNASDLEKILLLAVMMATLKASGSLVTYIASRNLTHPSCSFRSKRPPLYNNRIEESERSCSYGLR